MSHIDIKTYVRQTINVIAASDCKGSSLELYATRLLNELMSRRMDSQRAIKLVAEYKQLVKEQLKL